jgi:hypothetical protein
MNVNVFLLINKCDCIYNTVHGSVLLGGIVQVYYRPGPVVRTYYSVLSNKKAGVFAGLNVNQVRSSRQVSK